MITKEQCFKALKQYQTVQAASSALGISRHQFRRITKDLNQNINYEQYRNRGTTQIPISKGLVIQAPDNFDLFLTSDWHAGSESCDYKGLKSMVDRLKSTRNARAIFGGDQMECTPPGHHDGGRNSDSFIDAQIIRTTQALDPIKSKIDVIYGGKHGKGRLVGVQVDPDLIVASTLQVAYSTVPTVVQYVCPSGTVKVCGGHGRAGGENSMKELRKLREIYPDCAIYHLGHDHNLFAEPDGSLRYDSTGEEYWDPSWMCRTGSFLKYSDYARYGIMRPKPTGYLIAHIRKGKVDSIEVVKA
jgi:hypothetical protein